MQKLAQYKKQLYICSIEIETITKTEIMTTVTYQGETLESLLGQLNYTNEALAFEGLENWERKEYEAGKKELEFRINDIKERIDFLKNN